jgi:hypothetical protein
VNRRSAQNDSPEHLADTPWFWLATFGFVALVALLAVQGKFAQRQARLEQRYRDRLIAQEARAKLTRDPVNAATPVERGYEDEAEFPVAVSMAEARATTSLVSLAIVAGGIMFVGIAGLVWSRRASQTATTPGTDVPGPEATTSDRAEPQRRRN